MRHCMVPSRRLKLGAILICITYLLDSITSIIPTWFCNSMLLDIFGIYDLEIKVSVKFISTSFCKVIELRINFSKMQFVHKDHIWQVLNVKRQITTKRVSFWTKLLTLLHVWAHLKNEKDNNIKCTLCKVFYVHFC